MKKMKCLARLFLISGLFIAAFTACEKEEEVLLGSNPIGGTIVDADGNVYNTVQIGDQVWTVENLRTTKYNNGSNIPNLTVPKDWAYAKSGAYCNYNNLESNVELYGRLYNWFAISTGKLAPAGWRVATENDWVKLASYLSANRYLIDTTRLGSTVTKLICAKTNWPYSSLSGTPGMNPQHNNATGFTGLPGGVRWGHGEFEYIGRYAYWWTSTQHSSDYARHRYIHNSTADLLWVPGHLKQCGFAVRLVKN